MSIDVFSKAKNRFTMLSLEMMVEQYQEEIQPMIESFKLK